MLRVETEQGAFSFDLLESRMVAPDAKHACRAELQISSSKCEFGDNLGIIRKRSEDDLGAILRAFAWAVNNRASRRKSGSLGSGSALDDWQ